MPAELEKQVEYGEYNHDELARVLVEHKDRYVVGCQFGNLKAEITGNMRYSAESRTDFPAVGDWVKIIPMDEELAAIVEILPRNTVIERQSVNRKSEKQIIASNIDLAFIVQSVGHDFNINRLERYFAICLESGIEVVIVINKIDLIDEAELGKIIDRLNARFQNPKVLAISGLTSKGFEAIYEVLEQGKSYCFLGSSGVGKSTIINHLKGEDILKTNEVSESTNKGKHTTSHRELFVLDNGAIVIDTPGMRELGIVDQEVGIENTYDLIFELSKNCRYKDCTHTNEAGCAVIKAVEDGELPEEVFQNYHKLKREQRHYESTVKEKREFFKKQGKMFKAIKIERNKRKF